MGIIRKLHERVFFRIDPVTMNARKPKDDESGLAMLNRMNERHATLHEWGLSFTAVEEPAKLLDIGFGGGQNIKNMCELFPEAEIYGIDYSEASYKRCKELNACEVEKGRVKLEIGSAESLPYEADTFDFITALETVYYWPEIEECFKSVCRVMKEGGSFLVCDEDSSREGNEAIAEALSMNFYTADDLGKLLLSAGFKTVKTETHENGHWVCAVAVK